jgi:uncharacterized membrane protein
MGTTPEAPGVNPYGAPQAPVDDRMGAMAEGLALEPHRLPAGAALGWYGEAWRLYKLAPGPFTLLWVVFAVIIVVLSLVPFLGGLVTTLLTPVFVGGALIAFRSADRGAPVRVGDLFAAFAGRNVGSLVLIGLLQLVATFAVVMITGLLVAVMVGSNVALSGPAARNALGPMLVAAVVTGVIMSLLLVPVINACWLASGLTTLHDLPALDALRLGFRGTFRNLLPLVMWVLVTIGLALVASLPLLLGWLVVGPMVLGSVYAQYREVFLAAPRA